MLVPLVTVEVIQHQPALLGLLVATCYPQPNQKLRRLQSSADCRLKVILYSSQSSQTYSARINSAIAVCVLKFSSCDHKHSLSLSSCIVALLSLKISNQLCHWSAALLASVLKFSSCEQRRPQHSLALSSCTVALLSLFAKYLLIEMCPQ